MGCNNIPAQDCDYAADKWENFLDKTFTLNEYEGNNKVIDLSEAIKRNVKPGMTLYLGERANALICELIRQFRGSQPDFTMVMLFVMERTIIICKFFTFSNCKIIISSFS